MVVKALEDGDGLLSRCELDLPVRMIPGCTMAHLDGVVTGLELAGVVCIHNDPDDPRGYLVELLDDRPAVARVDWPEREEERCYLCDAPVPCVWRTADGDQAGGVPANGPSEPAAASDDQGPADRPSTSIIDPGSDSAGSGDGPRIVSLDPRGEAVCLSLAGTRLFGVVDSFEGGQGVALNDSEGNRVARLAWSDDMATLSIPKPAGGFRFYGISGGELHEFTNDQGTASRGENGFTTRIVQAQPGEIVGVVDQSGGCLGGVARDRDGSSTSASLTTPSGQPLGILTSSPSGLWLRLADPDGQLAEPFQPAASVRVPAPQA
jgi:hypothetical protein